MSDKTLCGLLCLLALIMESASYTYGPPLAACKSMFPKGHGVEKQTTDPPYTIKVNKTDYTPGDVIEIRVNSTGMHGITFFEGIFVQARRISCNADQDTGVGQFTVDQDDLFLTTMDCNGNAGSAVAHMNHSHIPDRVFHWKAPSASVGHIVFRATIVRRKITYWMNVQSPIIQDPTSKEPVSICSRAQSSQLAGFFSLYAVMFTLILIYI